MSDEAALIAKGNITPEEILALTHATTSKQCVSPYRVSSLTPTAAFLVPPSANAEYQIDFTGFKLRDMDHQVTIMHHVRAAHMRLWRMRRGLAWLSGCALCLRKLPFYISHLGKEEERFFISHNIRDSTQ